MTQHVGSLFHFASQLALLQTKIGATLCDGFKEHMSCQHTSPLQPFIILVHFLLCWEERFYLSPNVSVDSSHLIGREIFRGSFCSFNNEKNSQTRSNDWLTLGWLLEMSSM